MSDNILNSPFRILNSSALPAARGAALIAFLFSLLLAAALVILQTQDTRQSPLTVGKLELIKRQIQSDPNDAALKETYRLTDAQIRADFFTRHTRMTRAGYLLLASSIVLVLSLKTIRKLARRPLALADLAPPVPFATTPNYYAVAGASLAVLALFATGTALALRIPSTATLLPTEAPVAKIIFPDDAALRGNWPVFRGWGGNGIATSALKLPHWDAATGESILWKSPVPARGNSSPIVWGDRVFLTGAGDHLEVYCYSAATGELLWTSPLTPTIPDTPEVLDDTGLAAPTPATDGTHVYAIFASGDIAAFDFSGHRVWQRFLGKPESQYGYASSLTVHNGNVIVQWDMGKTDKGNGSALLALDGATGRTVWKTLRSTPASWGSPVVSANRIFTTAKPNVTAYDALTGSEIWHAALMNNDIACTPAVVGSYVYIANDQACVAAISNTGTGDVSESAVPWKQLDQGLPDIVSPTSDNKVVWTITSTGTLFCFDAAAGTKLYEQPLNASVHASPVLIGESLYITDVRGQTRQIAATRAFKEISASTIAEPVSASPAIAGGKLYIRSNKHLFCIGSK